jgi:hypothetical protein
MKNERKLSGQRHCPKLAGYAFGFLFVCALTANSSHKTELIEAKIDSIDSAIELDSAINIDSLAGNILRYIDYIQEYE